MDVMLVVTHIGIAVVLAVRVINIARISTTASSPMLRAESHYQSVQWPRRSPLINHRYQLVRLSSVSETADKVQIKLKECY